jgi:flavin reductase (DIM6/NTAB) family NADH-FMN oxidoreductase RutF
MSLDNHGTEQRTFTDPPVDEAPPGSHRALRAAFSAFATGITIITGAGPQGEPVGLTVNSFSSVSLEPPLVAWSLRSASPLLGCFVPGRRSAIHVLRAEQEALARRFACTGTDRFATVAWRAGVDGVPVIDDVLARFECVTESMLVAGDHRLLLARVERHVSAPGAPLLFAGGEFHVL